MAPPRAALFAGLFLTWVLAPAAAESRRGSDVTAQLVGVEREMIDAYVKGDASVLEHDLAPDYIHTNLYGTRTDKRQEIEEFYTPGRFKLAGGEVSNATARRYGAIAVLWADITWRGATYVPPGRKPVDLSGVYGVTRVYRKSAGRWRVVASHASRRPPVADFPRQPAPSPSDPAWRQSALVPARSTVDTSRR